MENQDERIKRINTMISNSNYIKTSENYGTFTAAQFFDFKVSDENDIPENIFKFNGLKDFLDVMSMLPMKTERNEMEKIITKKLLDRNIISSAKFKLTLLLNK